MSHAHLTRRAALAALALAGAPVTSPAQTAAPQRRPLVIGHRGACGYRPEHTLASYDLAIELGADFIEPDLVATKDGALIARHENEISGTTDAAAKFPERRATKSIDGVPVTGWFSEDFTLAEIKTLRARERLATRDRSRDGLYEVPTFEEVLAAAKAGTARTGRTIGVYPETKHPTYFAGLGLPLEPPLLAALAAAGHTGADAPVFIQSFEVSNLKALAGRTRVPLVQLMEARDKRPFDLVAAGDPRSYGDLMTPAALAGIARYAAGIGPFKGSVMSVGADGSFEPTRLVPDAHAAGLVVHPYTFRSDAPFLHAAYDGDPAAEYRRFYELGVDGVFSDFPDVAVRARATL